MDRIISTSMQDADAWQWNLRPRYFQDYIGQTKITDNLKVFVQAAIARNDSLDHVLLYGPPGLGKTTLAAIIAAELGVNFKQTAGPAIERSGDLAAILTHLQHRDVLFIDEIHRLKRPIEEILYSAMEDFALDIIVGKGAGARNLRLDIAHFTLIGATTRAGALSPPLRDRFGVLSRLDYYGVNELVRIINRNAEVLNIQIDDKGAVEIARRSRGTPRIANRLLKRVRDFALVNNSNISAQVATDALNALEVDSAGLDILDRNLLIALKNFNAPVGLDTLAAALSESKSTIEDICEPYLLQRGFILRTPRGRIITQSGLQHLEVHHD